MRIQMKKMIVETIETMIEGLEYSKECNNESAFSMIDQWNSVSRKCIEKGII